MVCRQCDQKILSTSLVTIEIIAGAFQCFLDLTRLRLSGIVGKQHTYDVVRFQRIFWRPSGQ